MLARVVDGTSVGGKKGGVNRRRKYKKKSVHEKSRGNTGRKRHGQMEVGVGKKSDKLKTLTTMHRTHENSRDGE